jgi:hypothetical protein
MVVSCSDLWFYPIRPGMLISQTPNQPIRQRFRQLPAQASNAQTGNLDCERLPLKKLAVAVAVSTFHQNIENFGIVSAKFDFSLGSSICIFS